MTQPLPERVVSVMASREWRMYHYRFHELRRYWLSFTKEEQEALRAAGWEPPRPAWDEIDLPITDNDSGEDFLYMHRQMIVRVNALLAEIGDPAYPRVEGWVKIPPPDDPEYPVPPAWFTPEASPLVDQFLMRSKYPASFERRFAYWERLCTDPGFLRQVSLGQLGSIIEETLYNGVRSRWSSPPGAWRPDPPPQLIDTIPEGYDDPTYDFLHDSYAMHVNPIYWKFFGWVDDRVEDWKIANGVFGDDFWQHTWVGKMPEQAPAPAK